MQNADLTELWIACCMRRNAALSEALAAAVEHAAVAHTLADDANARENIGLSAHLRREARDGERQAAELLAMLDGLRLGRDGKAKETP